ncbi:MAG: mannonate dehydratase [Clostridia bacterium]
MKITFRWYGDNDKVTLENIRQIPVVTGVVSAIYDTPVGSVWSEDSIKKLVENCHNNGLECEVIESVPVHEDIKLGLPTAQKFIENYCENLRRLAKYGVKCVCYNFMPVFDWLRSDLEKKQADGATALSYSHNAVLNMNPLNGNLSLPGWDSSYTSDGLKSLLKQYETIDEASLWKNIEVFLKAVIPVSEQVGINMAIHPDDPPWPIFGLPRIITNYENIKRFLNLVDSPNNGITLCTGSLGASADNKIIDIINMAKGRIHFAHIRNIKLSGERDFEETAHPTCCGSLDIYEILKALLDSGFDGYVRPDHGRMIWGEKGRYGYGLYDRALGACYIGGLYEAIVKNKEKNL